MSITAANAIITIGIPGIFNLPQQIQGFSSDDIFDVETIEMIEESMGIDGILTAGFKFVPIPMSVSLQADSVSVGIFDFWAGSQQAGIDAFPGFGTLALPSLQKKWVLNKGYLKGWPPMPSAGKVLKPLKYNMVWGQMIPQPF